MEHQLLSISPIDGRYNDQIKTLSNIFSEFAFIKYRIKVEIEYFIKLKTTLPTLSQCNIGHWQLRNIYKNLTIDDVISIKNKETMIKHDVKAIEYFIKNKIAGLMGNADFIEFIHFGLTSQDINSTAIALMLNDCLNQGLYDKLLSIEEILLELSIKWIDVPMMGRTHGQPALPTTMGKELKVFYYRLNKQLSNLKSIKLYCKFGGAVGNLNAHKVSYPNEDWVKWCNDFIGELGLNRSDYTTQVDNNDSIADLFDNMKRINIILIDLTQDIWQYVLLNYLKLKINIGEVGSSTMPHKVNPINFENAEGNFQLANMFLEFMSKKLPISRLQRDLSDSTVTRNFGVLFGYQYIALNSLAMGLKKIDINKEIINNDLNNHWEIISEAIQTILRKHGYKNPYEKLKELTQNKIINKEKIGEFINDLEISQSIKDDLLKIDTHSYTGYV